MNVLVVNAGSSSLKYQLMVVETRRVIVKGICERVGSPDSFQKHGLSSNEITIDIQLESHADAIAAVFESLVSGPNPAIKSLKEIDAIGHRVVQGGKYFDKSVLVDDYVLEKIEELASLAPLHNIPSLLCIKACLDQMPGIPNVCVFDTSFFQSLKPKNYMYPLPYDLCEKHAIRKYGAHGTSHRYIAERAAAVLNEPLDDLKLITCHLGNGCSVTAIDHGVALDTSMGLTPLDGLMMGTRSGCIDPAIVTYLMDVEGFAPQEMNDILNKKSGLLGISGISNDLRDVRAAAEAGNPRAILAYEMYSNSVKKFIGQYIALMAGVDAIVLSAGVGEHCERMRRMIFAGLQPLGIVLDLKKNSSGSGEREISSDKSQVKILVIPTNEEYMIARDTYEIINNEYNL